MIILVKKGQSESAVRMKGSGFSNKLIYVAHGSTGWHQFLREICCLER